MHSFKAKEGTIFHFNGGFDGEIKIVSFKDGSAKEISIESDDLLDFLAEYIRSKKISKIENMTLEELINT